MFFRVENLGPLRNAEVDLSKNLILLTGPNSTGKTYLAWSVYGLFRSPDAPKVFRKLADELLASPKQRLRFERIAALWPSILEGAAAQLAARLHLCFASERQYFANVGVALRPGPHEPRPRRSMSFFRATGDYFLGVGIGPRGSVEFSVREKPASSKVIPFGQIPSAARDEVAKRLGGLLGHAVLTACWPRCTLLPAERTDVETFARELSIRRTEIVDQAVEAELDTGPDRTAITRDVGRYPWPIQDSLRMANDLAYRTKMQSEFADLATDLEALLGGAVSVSKEGAIELKLEGMAPALGLHLTSSIVKSLASLVFFLRHTAREGDLLMIDEPELNLHPDNQRKVARVLAKAVNRGLRVIMSTHSDYVLREINNLVLLSRDTPAIRALRKEHGYSQSELLAPSKVGAYLFKKGTAKAVGATEDGFEVETIEDEINRMNAVSQAIYAALHE